MRNIVFMLGLMSCASLQAQGFSSNNKIDLSGQWRFSQGDAPTYEDVVKLPGSMLTNGKGNYIIYGKDNEISIKVYNGIENVCVGQDSHSVTDQTQGNWNGIIGKMELQAHQQQYIRNLQVYPDVKGKQIKVVMDVTGNAQKADFQFDVSGVKHSFSKIKRESDGKFSVIIPMGEDIRLWDEFHPNLYTLTATTGNFATQTENRNINQKNKNNYQTKKT